MAPIDPATMYTTRNFAKHQKVMDTLFVVIVFLAVFIAQCSSKFLEGTIKTSDNWAFLARFCFLSEEGQFEYHFEFNEDLGVPNLLLYYDTDDQWPAVYKSSKTCHEKEAVLHVEQNQIINLTVKHALLQELSGCHYDLPYETTTPRPRYTLSVPTLPTKKGQKKNANITTTTTANPRNAIPVSNSSVVKSTSTTTTPAPTLTTKSSRTTTVASSTILQSSTTDQDLLWSSSTADSTRGYNGIVTTSKISSFEDLESYDFTVPTTSRDFNSEFESIFSTEATDSGKIPSKAPIKKRAVRPPISPDPRAHSNHRQIVCHNARRFRSSRERWWFIALSNCNGNKGIHVKYKILMTNGPPGDYWHEHLSADEFYILPVLMAFCIAYCFMMLGVIVCSIELKSRQLLHTTYKIFCFSSLFQLLGILIASVAYLKYAVNGLSPTKVRRIGSVFMGLSETLFLLLMLLLAKGFTVTRGRLPLAASVKLTIFMCLYVVTYISIFIYEANVFDPGEVLYLYESPAGYGLIILRILAWCMFIYSTIFTLKHYPEKANFYYPFNVCGSLWFVAGPAFIISANTYIDKWVRESVVCAVLQLITFGGHLSFLILTMPSVANKNFPYHVRTTQIGIMELTGGTAGVSTIEQFGHHVYEPTCANGIVREPTIIVPLTRRTEEIFEGMYSQTARRASPDGEGLVRTNNHGDTISRNGVANGKDNAALENVMNWSMAKNVAAIELPNFERTMRNGSFGSSNSIFSDSAFADSRRTSINQQDRADNPVFQDYVRDVPVELFTISRMVVSSSTNGTTAHNDSTSNGAAKL